MTTTTTMPRTTAPTTAPTNVTPTPTRTVATSRAQRARVAVGRAVETLANARARRRELARTLGAYPATRSAAALALPQQGTIR